MAPLFPGLLLPRTAGLLKKRTELQEFPYSEFFGSFIPEAKELGRSWGVCAIQAAVGSAPVFRLGWQWSTGYGDRELIAVAAERDRILASMQRGLESARQA